MFGSVFKLVNTVIDDSGSWLQTGTVTVTFGGLAGIIMMIVGLLITAVRCRQEKPTPYWLHSLLSKPSINK